VKIPALLVSLPLVLSGPVVAQAAGLNPAALIAQYESSGNPAAQSNKSTASGLYGFINGTWATYAPQAGVSLAQYPTAASAPASVQTAVFYADFNNNGFSDWTCPGCDPAATAAIQAAGGAGAFAQGSTNPADYASLNTATGLQAYFAGNGLGSTAITTVGTDGLSVSTVDPGTPGAPTGTLPPVNSTPGALSLPFTWVYNQVITATQQEVTGDIGSVQTMVGHYLLPLAVLSLVVLLLRMLFGRYLIDHAAAWVARLALVVPLVAAGSTLYTQFVVQPVFGFPQWWAQYIAPAGGQFTLSSPAAPFDQVYTATAATEQKIWSEAHGLVDDIKVAVGDVAAWLLISLSLGALFIPFAVLTLLSDVLVVLGPILIPFALFQRTAFLFWNWVWATATVLLSLFAIDIVLVMYSNVMNALVTALGVTGTADNDMVGFWGASLVMVLLGFSAAYVPSLVSRIGTGVAVSMASASYFMSAGPVRDGAMRVINAPSNIIRRWTGV
jgi:hypothetical protein